MKRTSLIALIIALFSFNYLFAQDAVTPSSPYKFNTAKYNWYFSWGYNLDWYTKSDIHFSDSRRNGYYDFVIEDAKAEDRPGIRDVFSTDLAIPQYSFRIGFFGGAKRDWGFEFNYDHAKYVVQDGQSVRFKGKYFGKQYDTDTIIGKPFLAFEHTNGANFAMFMATKRMDVMHSKNGNHWLSLIGRVGGGFVFPRTDCTINNLRRDDQFHVAGYLVGVDAGLRYDFHHRIFFENEAKWSFVNYTSALLPYQGRARHHFWAFEYIFTLGYNF
ncbi:MAG: hypothetical protein ACK44N_03100 [Bacteroidota bacterium]|jgi:hypothetical protein